MWKLKNNKVKKSSLNSLEKVLGSLCTYWLMAWLLHHSHCGTLPHIGSCQWCQGWAWSPFQAAPRSLSGWSGHRKWWGWWRAPSVQNGLDYKNMVENDCFVMTVFWSITNLCKKDAAQLKSNNQYRLLPDLPMRWRYVSPSLGKSKLITTFTAWMSIPLVKRSRGKKVRI